MDQPPALDSDILSNAELCSRLQSVLTTVLPRSSSSRITCSGETKINLKIDGLFQPVTIAVSIGERYLTATVCPEWVISNRLSSGKTLVLKRGDQIIEFRGGKIDTNRDDVRLSNDIWWDVIHAEQQHFIDLVQGLAEVVLEYLESEKLCMRLMGEMSRVFPAASLTPTLTGVALDFRCNGDETHIRVMLRNDEDVGVVFWPADVFEAAFGDGESPDDEYSATLTFPLNTAAESFTIYRKYMDLCTDDLGEGRWWFYPSYDGNHDKLVAFATGMARVANDYFGIEAAGGG